jgi:hypothetical protein
MRAYVPKAPESVISAFEYAAAERTRLLGELEDVRIVDAAKTMSGRRDLFIDLVHYSEQGRETIAGLVLSKQLQTHQGSYDAVQ